MHDQLEDQLDGHSKTQIKELTVINLEPSEWPTVSRLHSCASTRVGKS